MDLEETLMAILHAGTRAKALDQLLKALSHAKEVERDMCAIVGGTEAEKCRNPDGQRVADAIRNRLNKTNADPGEK